METSERKVTKPTFLSKMGMKEGKECCSRALLFIGPTHMVLDRFHIGVMGSVWADSSMQRREDIGIFGNNVHSIHECFE